MEIAFLSKVDAIRVHGTKSQAIIPSKLSLVCFGENQEKGVSAEFYRLSAKQGPASRQCNFGRCLKSSVGVAQDLVRAARRWMKDSLLLKGDFAGAACSYEQGMDRGCLGAEPGYQGCCVTLTLNHRDYRSIFPDPE
jgi:hypothetical protein